MGEVKKEFFVGFDYGMGGLYFFIKACSKDEFEDKYPLMPIWDKVPNWMFRSSLPDRPRDLSYQYDELPEITQQEEQDREKFLLELRKNNTYDIDNLPITVHEVLVGDSFDEFLVSIEDQEGVLYFMIVGLSKEEILWHYPKLHIYENIPDWLLGNQEKLERIRNENRYHIQNLPEEIHKLFL